MDYFRYGRQLILPEFGLSRQIALKDSRVLIIGVGGLGCPAALHLASSGVGTIGLMDFDSVSLSNLPRQTLFSESDVGLPKVTRAKDRLARVSSNTNYIIFNESLTSDNAFSIIDQFHVVLDCTDNVTSRYLINDACVMLSRALISAAALGFQGQLTVYNYNGPCYRCLYPQPPTVLAGSCAENGIFPTITGIMGTLQAMEAIKVITSCGEPLSGRLLTYNGLSANFKTFKLRGRQSSCPVCGDHPSITELKECVLESNCCLPCGISVHEYSEIRNSKLSHVLLDVRNPVETEICHLSCDYFINIPHTDLFSPKGRSKLMRLIKDMFDGEKCPPVYVICKRGLDSGRVVETLSSHSEFKEHELVNIKGGLFEWHKIIDNDFVMYF